MNPRVQNVENQKMHFDIGRIYTAKIKDNRDPDRNGRLRVWLKESQYDEEDFEKWITVRYAPPFWGTTPDNKASENTFEHTKKSYGMWFVPPDLGNYVLVCFVNNNDAFWFASVPESFVNNMVPGIPSEKTYASSEGDLPASEYNRALTSESATRPVHDPLTNGLINQGLLTDLVRGQTSSSARREAPSRVHGILTARGNGVVFDDGWTFDELPDQFKSWLYEQDRKSVSGKKDFRQPGLNPANRNSSTTGERHNELVRFRTRSGTQILLSETYGHIYFITRDGNSWLELNNDGNIDVYGSGSLNLRAEIDFNIRADRDVNIESGRNINFKAAGDHTDGQGNIKLYSVNDSDWKVDGKMTIEVVGNFHQSSDAIVVLESGSGMHFKSGNVLNLQSSSQTSMLAGDDIVMVGSNIHFNGPAASTASSADSATLPDVIESNIKERVSAPTFGSNKTNSQVQDRTVETITKRTPTHEPWVGRNYENPAPLPKPVSNR